MSMWGSHVRVVPVGGGREVCLLDVQIVLLVVSLQSSQRLDFLCPIGEKSRLCSTFQD